MQKESLRKQFNALLRTPSEKALEHFVSTLRCEITGTPACPNCNSGDVVRKGFNPRRHGMEQQFYCSKCGHIYTRTSIKTRELRQRYPECVECGGPVKRSGFWKWRTLDGRRKKQQRYECINSDCGTFFSQGPPEIIEI